MAAQSYVSYRVRTRTNAPGYSSSPESIRRFRDFVWLHDQLHEHYKGAPASRLPPPVQPPVRPSQLFHSHLRVATAFPLLHMATLADEGSLPPAPPTPAPCPPLSHAPHNGRMLAGIIIPPLPEKSVVQKYQQSTDFISQRQQALNIFVNRVVRPSPEPLTHVVRPSPDLRGDPKP